MRIGVRMATCAFEKGGREEGNRERALIIKKTFPNNNNTSKGHQLSA